MPAKRSKMRKNNINHQTVIAGKQVTKPKTKKAKSAKPKQNKKSNE